jgi:PST family polysaccharide transporter
MVLDIKSIFTKNFINLTLNQGVNVIATLIYTPILFQTLGDENFGLMHLAFSIVIMLSILTNYGYSLNGPVKIFNSSSNDNRNLIVNEVLVLRITISLFVIFFFFPIIAFYVDESLRKILFFSLIILFTEALNPLFYLQGINKILPQALLNLFSKSLYLLLIILFISEESDTYLANFFYGLSISFFFLIFWARNYVLKKIIFRISIEKLIRNLKDNFKFFLSTTYTHFTLNSALIILNFFVTDKELGRFTLAFKIAFLLRMIPVFFVQSGLQSASGLKRNSEEKFKNYISKYFKIGLLSTFLIAIITNLFSDYIIYLFANEEIGYSSKILSHLSFIPFLAMLNFKNLVFILVNDFKSILNKATFSTLIFMIFSSLILCKLYGGIGLAYALLSTEIFSFIIHYLLIKKR